MISIICPTYNEERFIEACLQSMLAQDFPKDQWELLLVDGGSTDQTRIRIAPYLHQNINIRLLDNPYRTTPYAINIGIRSAKGEYICRIDAHSSFPTNYLNTLSQYMKELPDAANVGCVCQTLPANDSAKAQAISIACSHPLGVGNSTFRIATIDRPTKVDTVPFGFWHKSLFDEIGFFDEELTRNQDDEFNARTIQHGKSIYLIPGIHTIYYARDSITKTWRMFYQYGLFKPLVNSKIHHPASIRQFVPMLFVLGIVIGFPLCFVHTVLWMLYVCIIGLYVLLISVIGCKYRNAYLPVVFATIHLSYGIGYWHGIGKRILKRPFNVETNR